MNTETLSLLIFTLPTILLFSIGIYSKLELGKRPIKAILQGKIAMIASLGAAVYGSVYFWMNGFTELNLFSWQSIGITFRIDSVSMIMYSMIAILGLIVLRYSANYLNGEKRHSVFMARMSATIAAVQLLVISGNLFVIFLAWFGASVTLHKLILFYSDRDRAKNAAKKKFIIARLSDVALFIGCVLLYLQFDTGNLEVIFQALKSQSQPINNNLEWAGLFFVLAAIFKSAQFPMHGWLVEVMETPTPVSALLHAGLLNAGPFLIIRMAYLMDAVYFAPIVLIVVGAISAFYGSIVYITQPSVKTALSYSSVAHMGFTLMTCGFGVYSAAMLHLTAHSFYKAHAFLSSGTNIEKSQTSRFEKTIRKGSAIRITAGIISALTIYLGISFLWGFDFQKDFKLLVIGGVIVLGVSQLLVQAYDSNTTFKAILSLSLRAILLTISFFLLENFMHHLLNNELPVANTADTLYIILMVFVLSIFSLIIFTQVLAPALRQNNFTRQMGVHIRNGFYINVYFDRIINAYKK